MNKYVRRFIYEQETSTSPDVEFLAYPFIFTSFFFGLGFTTPFGGESTYKSSLYQALNQTDPLLPYIWGAAALTAGTLAFILIPSRKLILGEIAAFLGFMTWLYAIFIYGQGDSWLLVITVGFPHLFFWTWLYFRIKQNKNHRITEGFVDPQ